MRGRTVLILLILVVALVAFIELYEHELPSSEERAVLEKLVLNMEVSEITAVDLVWGEMHVRLERQLIGGDGQEDEEDSTLSSWRIVVPMSARADVDLVASLIESLVTLEKNRRLHDSTLDEVGLNPPRLVVSLTGLDRVAELWVGSHVPAGNSMIVTAGNESEIVVVDDSLWVEMTREPGSWRSREVLDLDQESIERVALESADRRLVLARRGREFWLESPFVDRADAEKVASLLATLASMRIVAFADELPETVTDPSLDPAVGKLEISATGSGEILRVDWGGEVQGSEPHHYARADGQVFSTDAQLQEYFDTPMSDWRSLELTSMESFQIDAIRVEQSGQDTMSLGRKGANWTRDEDEISFTSVSDLLHTVAGARADVFLAETKEDFLRRAPSEPVLEMKLQGGETEQTVSFYPHDREGARAVVDDREVVLLVGKDEFTEILAKVDEVRAAGSVKTDANEQLPSGPRNLNPDQQR